MIIRKFMGMFGMFFHCCLDLGKEWGSDIHFYTNLLFNKMHFY